MNDINSLLNIDAAYFDDFHLLANAVIDSQMDKMVAANCKRLRYVEERMMTDYEPVADKRSVDTVIKRVKESVANQTHLSESWSAHELRIVSYYIMYFEDDENSFLGAVELLDKHWRDLYFNGTVFYLLNSWNLLHETYRKAVSQLVISKLKQYKGKNKKYLLLKNHANYFDENGPSRMARLVSTRDHSVLSAPTLLGFKPSTISMSYYSDVIVKYVENKDDISLEEVESLLSAHSLDRTKKLVLSEMVLRADCSNNAFVQTQVSKLGPRLLGDITIAATWAPFPGATDDQIKTLKLAKELVNKWFVRKVIDVFFDICVQDEDRKKFWLQYSDMISHFMIAGSSSIRRELQTDSRVGELFDSLFIDTNSRYSFTAALIMYIKDRVIVEFSDYGSLYVYKRNNETISYLNSGVKKIRSVNDLKNTSLGKLVDESWYRGYYTLYDEGSLRHAGYWQERLTMWINKKLKDESLTFSEEPDNDFKPVEIPKQSARLEFKDGANDDSPDSSIVLSSSYSKYLATDISSRKFFGDRCRIVANSKGFYVAITSETNQHANRYYFISPLISYMDQKVTGDIWIKSPDQKQWRTIIHSFADREVTVGEIRQSEGEIQFKQGLGLVIKRIKL